jgi:hypothetical protein
VPQFPAAAAASMTSIGSGLDRPVSFQIIGRTAYVVTLGGDVWSLRL